MAFDPEDLSHPPTGGYVKMILLGVVLPLIIAYFGIRACLTEETICYYRGHSGPVVEHGAAAKALGVTYVSAGLFGHARWFWGLLPACRVFELGTVISLLGIAGGLGWLFWQTFFAWI